MTEVVETTKKVGKKATKKVMTETVKSDETLLKDAKERIMRLQVGST